MARRYTPQDRHAAQWFSAYWEALRERRPLILLRVSPTKQLRF